VSFIESSRRRRFEDVGQVTKNYWQRFGITEQPQAPAVPMVIEMQLDTGLRRSDGMPA